jgi:YidC/Oxa1 family membrane protein insertase
VIFLWDTISEWVAKLLQYLHYFTGSWGIAIILFTLLIRVITHPLNKKQIDGMQKMQRLQPQVKILQEKYKNDKEAMSRETMQLYKNNKVNPMSGCLPLLIQLPIFILLYRVLSNLVSTEGFYATFLWIDLGGSVYSTVVNACAATTEGLSESVIAGLEILKGIPSTKLGITNVGYAVLNNPAGLLNFGYYLANSILLLANGALMWLQQKFTSSGNPQMTAMIVMMPVLITFICLSLPGGVLLYWGVSSMLAVVQQAYTAKRTKSEMKDKPALYKDKPMGNH